MRKIKRVIVASIFFISNTCPAVDMCNGDQDCLLFEDLSDKLEYGVIIQRMRLGKRYSEGAQYYIGQAYAGLAAEEPDFEQRAAWYLKSVEYGYFTSYMDLFRLFKRTDPARAYDYLYDYERRHPKEGELYFILGQFEFDKGLYKTAMSHLSTAKKLLDAQPSGLDWLLFKAAYLSGDYQKSSGILNTILNKSFLSDADLLELKNDARFAGFSDRKEFYALRKALNAASDR